MALRRRLAARLSAHELLRLHPMAAAKQAIEVPMSDGEASEAGSEDLRALLVTHNVCGVFDNLENALPFWVKELQALVREQGADFVALHMQEVGGTEWKKGNLRLETFTQAFEAGFPEFWCSGLLCDNCTQTPEAFSALGCLYLVTSPTPRLA